MFLSSLDKELCTKEENNKTGCTLTFGGQCKSLTWNVELVIEFPCVLM